MASWTDDFNRTAEGVPIDPPWFGTSSGSNDLSHTGTNVISSGDSDDDEYYYGPASGNVGADQYAQVAVTVTANGSGSGFGPMVRHIGTSTRTWIRAVVDNLGVIYVKKCTAGTTADIGTRNAGSWSAGDVLRMEISGTSPNIVIKVFKNGVQVGTDFTGVTAADSGVPGFAYSSTLPTNDSIDDWEGGDLVTTPPATDAPEKIRVVSSGLRW